jgi:hypothetical protein
LLAVTAAAVPILAASGYVLAKVLAGRGKDAGQGGAGERQKRNQAP